MYMEEKGGGGRTQEVGGSRESEGTQAGGRGGACGGEWGGLTCE